WEQEGLSSLSLSPCTSSSSRSLSNKRQQHRHHSHCNTGEKRQVGEGRGKSKASFKSLSPLHPLFLPFSCQQTAAAQASLALQCWREAAAGGGGKSAGTSQPLDASDLVQPSLDRLMLASLCHETDVGK
ncbi:unnamed protein product, partial [Closterium sp. NIES-54]